MQRKAKRQTFHFRLISVFLFFGESAGRYPCPVFRGTSHPRYEHHDGTPKDRSGNDPEIIYSVGMRGGTAKRACALRIYSWNLPIWLARKHSSLFFTFVDVYFLSTLMYFYYRLIKATIISIRDKKNKFMQKFYTRIFFNSLNQCADYFTQKSAFRSQYRWTIPN